MATGRSSYRHDFDRAQDLRYLVSALDFAIGISLATGRNIALEK